ncbi:MAG: sulfate transporter CysZ [Oleibacter sp.]|nr:sulfate transporter CysZ [Thalassolituus sp.]
MRGNPLLGMKYLWRGFQNLNSPGLRRYVALPLLLNVVIMGAASVWFVLSIDQLLGQVTDFLPSFLSFLYWILMPLAVISMVVGLAYFFSTVLMIIAGPLNGLLAEKVETMQGGQLPDESLWGMTWRTLGREMIKLFYYLPRYLGIFILGWIPVIGLIAPMLWIWFGGWMMAVQYADYSFDNHTRPFKDVRVAMSKDLFTVMGFGFLVSLLLTVPVVNLFIMPAAVIGATLLRIERLPLSAAETTLVSERKRINSSKSS